MARDFINSSEDIDIKHEFHKFLLLRDDYKLETMSKHELY